MTDNSQAAHEAAWDYAGSVVCQLMLDPNFNGGFGQETCRAYHEHMLAHMHPAIEAAAREAALREAADTLRNTIPKVINVSKADQRKVEIVLDASAKAILALIKKEPTNAA